MLAVCNFDPSPVDCLELVPGEKHSYGGVFVGSDSVVFKHKIETKPKCVVVVVIVVV